MAASAVKTLHYICYTMHQRPSAPSPLSLASYIIVLCKFIDDGYTDEVIRSNDRDGGTTGEAFSPCTNDLCLILCLQNHTIKQSSCLIQTVVTIHLLLAVYASDCI
jgi:hypothetical protein